MISILLADDHEVMRHGIRNLLESRPEYTICGEARDGEEAVQMANERKPDVIVMDISMPKMDGLAAARSIRSSLPGAKILFFTMHDTDSLVRDVLHAGASGYILKSDAPKHLVSAIEAISQEQLYFSGSVSRSFASAAVAEPGSEAAPADDQLTPREREIVAMLASGKRSKEVAGKLFISVHTVESHRRTIFRKLEINSLAELILYAVRNRLIEP